MLKGGDILQKVPGVFNPNNIRDIAKETILGKKGEKPEESYRVVRKLLEDHNVHKGKRLLAWLNIEESLTTIEVVTTSNQLKKGLTEEDKEIIRKLQKEIQTSSAKTTEGESLAPQLFKGQVTVIDNSKGSDALGVLLAKEGLKNKKIEKILERVYIPTMHTGDITLTYSTDDFLDNEQKRNYNNYDFLVQQSGLGALINEPNKIEGFAGGPPVVFIDRVLELK